jgi:hypothetical protein
MAPVLMGPAVANWPAVGLASSTEAAASSTAGVVLSAEAASVVAAAASSGAGVALSVQAAAVVEPALSAAPPSVSVPPES